MFELDVDQRRGSSGCLQINFFSLTFQNLAHAYGPAPQDFCRSILRLHNADFTWARGKSIMSCKWAGFHQLTDPLGKRWLYTRAGRTVGSPSAENLSCSPSTELSPNSPYFCSSLHSSLELSLPLSIQYKWQLSWKSAIESRVPFIYSESRVYSEDPRSLILCEVVCDSQEGTFLRSPNSLVVSGAFG